MLCVLISLLPTTIAGVLHFGARAGLLILCTTVSAVVFEFLCRLVMRREQTIGDLSAAVTGLLLGLNLPPDLPFWQAVVGSFVAIVIVKQLFGGLGQNFANPAIVGRIVLMLSFQSAMTSFRDTDADALTSATPLVTGTASYWDLFLGNIPGCIGETCSLALLLGGLYLLLRGIISPIIPFSYLGVFALCTLLSGGDVLYQLLSGGLLLGAFFMATDYVTTPVTGWGKFLFGAGCGALTFVIRRFGGYPEGVSFSILLMNLLTPYLDRFTRRKPFGVSEALILRKEESKDA